MADKICGDGIGNSTGRLYTAEVDLITPSTMYGSSPGEPRTLVQPADSAGPKKKPTSFQITSVTVQGSRLSNDGGDESADDLDESHTEDQNSDILDCSKTTDLDNDQLSPTEETGAATGVTVAVTDEPAADPVAVPSDAVPSSSFTSVTMSPAVVSTGGALTIVTSAPANSGSGAAPDVPINPDHWQRRFKVVKIVSSEPFGRGRWLCMDFVDPPAMQGDAKPGDDREAVAAADLPPAVSNEAVAHVYEIPVGQTYPANSQQSGPLYGIILPVTSNVQGTPLSVLQPISEQPPEPSQTAPSDAGPTGPTEPATDPVPENVNKSATEEDSERWGFLVYAAVSARPFSEAWLFVWLSCRHDSRLLARSLSVYKIKVSVAHAIHALDRECSLAERETLTTSLLRRAEFCSSECVPDFSGLWSCHAFSSPAWQDANVCFFLRPCFSSVLLLAVFKCYG